ncbi:uncharacterized protein V1516DRAFT_685377 [Lipomyces oligophaga]|uniref:uncharacterized protein n=1 Tax=Lipomyces oligophaga TaxID=45792 RepID=UPI0034CFC44C
MDNTIISTLQSLLPALSSIPPDLIRLTSSFYIHSQSLIPLASRVEHARIYLAAHLAAVRLADTLSLPPAMPHQLPVSSRQYSSLFAIFEDKLPSSLVPVMSGKFSSSSSSSSSTPSLSSSSNTSFLPPAALTKFASALGLQPRCLHLARSALSSLFAIRDATTTKRLARISCHRPFICPKHASASRRSTYQWAVFGAALFVLFFGDVIESIIAEQQQPLPSTPDEEGIKPRKPRAKLHVRLQSSPQQALFLAKFHKLSGQATDPELLTTFINELELICFNRVSPSSSFKYAPLSRKLSGQVINWVSTVRAFNLSRQPKSEMDDDTVEQTFVNFPSCGSDMMRSFNLSIDQGYQEWSIGVQKKLRRIIRLRARQQE